MEIDKYGRYSYIWITTLLSHNPPYTCIYKCDTDL